MADALIGFSGFVGSTLLRQRSFEACFRSTDIGQISGRTFGTVICAGAPAKKWLANREPEADRATIDMLIAHLRTIACERFILISTVDVFAEPLAVDEASPVRSDGLEAYGRHRRLLEQFVEDHFHSHLIVRLPGLVGPGLRKNVVFDLHNQNQLAAIDSRARFQFYPMVNLWADIQTALAAGLQLVHLTGAPITVAQVAGLGFGRAFDNQLGASAVSYDMRSRHAALFGGAGNYQYNLRETVQAVRCYAQSEPKSA